MIAETQRLETVIGIPGLFEKGIINIPKLTEGCGACPNYGRRWACPPFGFDVEKYWRKYGSLRVVAVKIEVGEALRGKKYTSAEYADFCEKLLSGPKSSLNEELLRLERETPGSRAISLGSCDSCAEPCPRAENKPCRRPDMRPTLEALGADVSRLTQQYLHLKLLWAENGIPPEYFVLVGGVLLGEKPDE